MAGAFKIRLPKPRYNSFWDIETVLNISLPDNLSFTNKSIIS